MKKIFIILLVSLVLVGCGANEKPNNKNENNTGKITEQSKKYLSKGYIINVYRSMIPLSDSIEDMGKGNVQIVYNILLDYYLDIDYQNENEYLVSQSVKNIKIIKSPKKGIINDIYGNYQSYSSPDFKIVGTNNVYKKTFSTPVNTAEQNSIAFVLDNVAYMDSLKYQGDNSTRSVYDYLGIDNDSVTMKVSFRVELTIKDGKTFYKDFLIDLPPSTYDISGSEFRTDFLTDDIKKMEAFIEN